MIPQVDPNFVRMNPQRFPYKAYYIK